MIPLVAVLDLLAEDWVRSRQESARQFGSRESRIVTWIAGVRRFRRSTRATVPAAVTVPATPPATPRRAA